MNFLFVMMIFSVQLLQAALPTPDKFVIPLTDCKSQSAYLYKPESIDNFQAKSNLLICISEQYFLECRDAQSIRRVFELKQENKGRYVYTNSMGTLILDTALSQAIFTEFQVHENNRFSNLMCKGLFFKNYARTSPNVNIKDGLKNLIKKEVDHGQ